MPSVRFQAVPSGSTSSSLTIKSVSGAEVEANTVAIIGPVTSVLDCNVSVSKTRTSSRFQFERLSSTPTLMISG